MLDAFHIVTLAGHAPGEVRCRVQQDTTGHRGRTGDPLHPHPTLKSPINGSSELSVGDRVLSGGCG